MDLNLGVRALVRWPLRLVRRALGTEALRTELAGIRQKLDALTKHEHLAPPDTVAVEALRGELASARSQLDALVKHCELIASSTDLGFRDILMRLDQVSPLAGCDEFRLVTDHPIAFHSDDHKHPRGTRNDNTRHPRFVRKCETVFGRKIRALDLGCAGGGLVLDFLLAGHSAVGLEGSDY